MSVDTSNARRSVHGYGVGSVIAPEPDNAIGSTDRRAISWLYWSTLNGQTGALTMVVDTAPIMDFDVDTTPIMSMQVDAYPLIGLDADS